MAELADSLGSHALSAAKDVLIATSAAYDGWLDRNDVVLSPVLSQLPVPIGHITGETPIDDMIERLAPFASYTPLHNAAGAERAAALGRQ